MVYPPWKAVWQLLKNQNIILPYVPTIQLPEIYLLKVFQKPCKLIFTAALFTIAKTQALSLAGKL